MYSCPWSVWNRSNYQRSELCLLFGTSEGILMISRLSVVSAIGKWRSHKRIRQRAPQSSQRTGKIASFPSPFVFLIGREWIYFGGTIFNALRKRSINKWYRTVGVCCYHWYLETGGLLRLSIGLMQVFSSNKTDFSHLLVSSICHCIHS